MDNLYWLDQIQTQHHQQVGDQALHLSYLHQKGYPIAASWVISTALFREFLETIQWADPLFLDLAQSSLRVNLEDATQLQAIARQIRQAIVTTPLPIEWIAQLQEAVYKLHPANPANPLQAIILRPSLALKSAKANGFAPTIDPEAASLLEAQVCWTEAKSLETALKRLWAELFRARNLLYWQRSQVQLHQVQLAVIVQPMGAAIASGYLQRQATGWEVLATWGFPQAIAQGEVLPDVYQLDVDGSVQAQKLGSQTITYRITSPAQASDLPLQPYPVSAAQDRQFVLDAADLQALGQLSRRLTADFSDPLILEWTRDRSGLSLTQLSRRPSNFSPESTEVPPETAIVPLPQPIPKSLSESPPERRSPIVSGLAAAPGQVVAQATVIEATVITDLNLAAIQPGTILVVLAILPDWLPLLKQAAGVIAEQGGMTSHGAIVARELGIPAVVGANQASQKIHTGDWLLINGDRGEIYSVAADSVEKIHPTPLSFMNIPP
ncbi:MAG: hypothetical protein HC780_06725, partial [Leptolyngbyaceae cyanobacterium CSU_1_3]|nr:hypothetical protein [Leptolyngbyaceae cyanobacterium CSU_1_3]